MKPFCNSNDTLPINLLHHCNEIACNGRTLLSAPLVDVDSNLFESTSFVDCIFTDTAKRICPAVIL